MLAVLRQADRALWLRSLAWATAIALATGILTVLIPNSFFSRLGVSGALSYFAPLQPLLGAGALLLMLAALRRSLRSVPTTVLVAESIPAAQGL